MDVDLQASCRQFQGGHKDRMGRGGAGSGAGRGRGGGGVGMQSGEARGKWLNAGQLDSVSSPNTVSGPEGQSPALPSFSAAFCKALS